MANLDEILKKSQEKLLQKELPKKIKRTGPTRPWREIGMITTPSQPLDSSSESLETLKTLTSNSNTRLNEQKSAPLADFSTESKHTDHPTNDSIQPILEFSNNSVTIAEQFRNKTVSDSVTITEQLRNNSVTNNIKNINKFNKNSNNSVTIPEQFRNKTVSDSVTIAEQLRNDSVTNTPIKQDSLTEFRNNSVTIPEQFRNNSVSESVTNSVTIAEQFRNNSVTNAPISFRRLSGNKLTAILTIFSLCQENSSNETGDISRNIFELKTGMDPEVFRTTTNRLIKDNYISKVSSKRGVGGYINFMINPHIYNECLNNIFRNNSVTIQKQLRNNTVTESVTESVTNPSSKIDSNNILTKLTNKSTTEVELSNTELNSIAQDISWFKSLNFSSIPYIKPMMINSSIRKLVEEKLNQDDAQIFINKFKNWISTQHKIQSPLAIFCDKIKEYALEGDSAVLTASSDEEIEADRLFALDIEKRRSELDLIAKAKIYKLEQDNELKFKAWIESASDEDKIKIYPENAFAKFGSDIYLMGLKAAFLEKLNG